ncbi:DNA replication/repair protein RecF [Fodinicurvata sp. EGI_FJ10296]|uniref:DNA replication/repair protein RecF n=1 Tax=Fodinicurvata sp. EGI_FJ10296 TaxID=3231908 RepID=UPI0034533D9B
MRDVSTVAEIDTNWLADSSVDSVRGAGPGSGSDSAPDCRPDPAEGTILHIDRLSLTDFRNHSTVTIETAGRSVVLAGPNGAGKTNILEAVSFLSPGRGLRRATLVDVARNDAPADRHWAVSAILMHDGRTVRLGTGPDPEVPTGQGRRLVRIDGQSVSQAALGDRLAMVWLTPAMDRLFLEGAGNRRRFLDRLVYGHDSGHAGALSAYEHAMRERSRLLRSGRFDRAWLDGLEETMARKGIAVAAGRRFLVERLQLADSFARYGDGMVDTVFPRADIDLSGSIETWLVDRPALEVEERFRTLLRESRSLDSVAGGAADGIHRSDLLVSHRAKGVGAAQCSTGEQKALLLGLILANARLLAKARGAAPILLFDEVAAHLDSRRRAALFAEIKALGAQAWFTGTDAALFEAMRPEATVLTVDDGTISLSS